MRVTGPLWPTTSAELKTTSLCQSWYGVQSVEKTTCTRRLRSPSSGAAAASMRCFAAAIAASSAFSAPRIFADSGAGGLGFGGGNVSDS